MSRLLKDFSKNPLAFGGAAISGEGAGYGFGEINEDTSMSLLGHAFDREVRVFDTAPIYGFGLSEKRLGKAFKKKREEVFFISKSGVTWHENKRVNMSNDPKVTTKMLEQSLRDLQSDYIDLYMIHWPDEKVDIRYTMEVLHKAKLKGKIKHIGLCNTYLEDLKLAEEIDKIEVIQSQLNFFESEVVEDVLNPIFQSEIIDDKSFMGWGTFDKGILTKRVTKDRSFDKSDCRSSAPWWKSEKKSREKKYSQVENISELLKKSDYSLVEFALSCSLNAHELVDMVLCGTKDIDQLDKTLDALKHLPSKEFITNIKTIIKSNIGSKVL